MTEETRGASKAINKTIGLVEEALGMEFERGDIPSESREIMIAMLERTVADLRDTAAQQEDVIDWGSSVILKGPRQSTETLWKAVVAAHRNRVPSHQEMVDLLRGHEQRGDLLRTEANALAGMWAINTNLDPNRTHVSLDKIGGFVAQVPYPPDPIPGDPAFLEWAEPVAAALKERKRIVIDGLKGDSTAGARGLLIMGGVDDISPPGGPYVISRTVWKQAAERGASAERAAIRAANDTLRPDPIGGTPRPRPYGWRVQDEYGNDVTNDIRVRAEALGLD